MLWNIVHGWLLYCVPVKKDALAVFKSAVRFFNDSCFVQFEFKVSVDNLFFNEVPDVVDSKSVGMNFVSWSKQCESAVEQLKQALQNAQILGYPNDTDPYTLTTNASLFGIGAIISQRQQWCERVFAYASITLSKTQQNYSATKRELFATDFFTQNFKNYLLGQTFLIVTDHRALTWLYSFKEPDGLWARWIEKLEEFDFEIKHEAGKKILHADCLSRVPTRLKTKSKLRSSEPNEYGRQKNLVHWTREICWATSWTSKKRSRPHYTTKLVWERRRPQRKNMAGASRALCNL